MTDGPFAETREPLGGYCLVDAKDLDEAMALTARIPSALMGAIEARPLRERDAGDGIGRQADRAKKACTLPAADAHRTAGAARIPLDSRRG